VGQRTVMAAFVNTSRFCVCEDNNRDKLKINLIAMGKGVEIKCTITLKRKDLLEGGIHSNQAQVRRL
jgi:hypothetical protein